MQVIRYAHLRDEALQRAAQEAGRIIQEAARLSQANRETIVKIDNSN